MPIEIFSWTVYHARSCSTTCTKVSTFKKQSPSAIRLSFIRSRYFCLHHPEQQKKTGHINPLVQNNTNRTDCFLSWIRRRSYLWSCMQPKSPNAIYSCSSFDLSSFFIALEIWFHSAMYIYKKYPEEYGGYGWICALYCPPELTASANTKKKKETSRMSIPLWNQPIANPSI